MAVTSAFRVLPGGRGEAQPATLAELVAGLRAGAGWAKDEVVRRYGVRVRRVLHRVLGEADPEHADLVQDVFVRIITAVTRLEDAGAFEGWIIQIAVLTAREHIRGRQRRRRFVLFGAAPEVVDPRSDGGLVEASRCVYRVLDAMPVDERLVFSLRKVGGMELAEVAEACGMSLSTVRRRLAKAEARFAKLARQHEALAPWLDGAEDEAAPEEDRR